MIGKLIEVCRFCDFDDKLGVNSSGIVPLDLLRSDVLDRSETIFGKDLRELGDERDAHTHSFNLDSSVLLHNELAQEESFIETSAGSNSVNVGFVELVSFRGHAITCCGVEAFLITNKLINQLPFIILSLFLPSKFKIN